MADKLEFKITHDNNRKEVKLGEMSPQVANAFVKLIQSITRIVELTPENEGTTICIKEGSAVVSIEGPSVKSVEESYQQVLKKESSDGRLVEEWRKVQTVFSKNGITYEASFTEKNIRKSILGELVSAKRITKRKSKRPPAETNVEFLVGHLIEVGGKKPNIHIETSDGERLTISCNELKANKAKAFLYEKIWLSVWLTGSEEKKKYEMCDSYWDIQQPIFDDFTTFIKTFKGCENEVESLKLIHYKCQNILKTKNYGIYRKFLRLFNNDKTDINVLKTLLIVSSPFKTNDKIEPIFNELEELFNRKTTRF
jgi:hypothetical protein